MGPFGQLGTYRYGRGYASDPQSEGLRKKKRLIEMLVKKKVNNWVCVSPFGEMKVNELWMRYMDTYI